MWKKLGSWMLLPVVVGALSGCAVHIVNPGEAGLMWRPFSTGVQKEPLPPGTVIHPLWEEVITYSIQLSSFREQVVVLSKDDLKIAVTSTAIVRPIQAEVAALNESIGQNWYRKVVQPKFRTSIRNVLAKYTMHEISKSTSAIESELLTLLRERLAGQHVELQDVIIDDIKFSDIVLRAVETKLAKEQEREQMKFERQIAEQEASIALIRAQADADAMKIRAKGQADAQDLIGQKLSREYLQLKAMESPNAKYFFIPQGEDNLPVMLDVDD